jgi:alpha-tubulin suppressor-like RCC1 family protein
MADKSKKGKKGGWLINKGGKNKDKPEPITTHITGTVDQELLDAAEQGDLARVKALIEGHRDDPGYINACDKMGASALHCAAMGPHIEVCEYLINEGASVTLTNAENTTPLHYIVRKAPKKTQHHDETNPPGPLSLQDLLAGRRSAYIRLLDLMLDKGAGIDAQSIRSETPLHQACTRTNEEAVRWLLANNAELHVTNKMKETPLATLRGQECYIAELLELADTEDTACTMRGLLTWGFGGHGMLGYNVNSSTPERSQPTPRQAPEALSFTPLNDRFITNTACGSYVTAALTSSEEVFVWGRGRGSSVSGADHWYLLGNGQQDNDEVTPVLLSLPPIAKVSLGVNHGAVVTQDGILMTWGFGGHGQLGRGDKKNLPVPTAVPMQKKVTQVVCCETHTIALTDDGCVWTWGGGDHGQLGHGDVAERLIPTRVAGVEDVVEIAGSSTHSVCVTATGSVYNWGTLANSSTPIYVPLAVQFFDERDIRISHVACGFNITVAVSEVGDTYSWGTGRQLGHTDSTSEPVPRLVEGLRDKSVRRVSCGSLHLVALTDRGQLFTVGKDSFGQCGCRTGELITTPTRITAVSYNNLPAQTVPLHNVVSIACGERHTACVVDIARSLRDKYIWKMLELLRSLLRSLYAIVEVYQLPLKSKHGHTDVRARLSSLQGQTIPFVPETDIATMFDAVEPLIRFNSQLLHEFERALDSWGPGSCFGHLFNGILDEKHVVEYFDNLPKALATLETICGNNPQFIGYLSECKKVAESMRKSEPYEEESREMDLSPLLLEPYFVYERFLKLMEGIKQHTPQQHPDRANIAKALQHLTRIRAVKDSMIAQDSRLGKAPSVRTLNAQLDGLTEYKSTCKQLYKRGKKIAILERSLAEERAYFASLLSLLRSSLGPDESHLSVALEAYADLERRLGAINNQNSNRLMDNFAMPMQHLVLDLDNSLPSFTSYKKAADDAYNDYVAHLGKLLLASKQKDSKTQLDPKKFAEAEKEVQQKKRILDAQAGELASRLRVVSDKKEVVQWAFLRAMRSEADSITQATERVHPLLPHMDTLEIILREKVRKEWGQHLAATVYTEMASLPPDFASDSDSSILAQVMTKLDEPITLGGNNTFAPNFVPLVDLLAGNSLSVVNSLVVTAEDEQEAVLRSVVRILDAYQKAIPLIKRGITAEVETTTDPGTLFRLNSIATRLMSAYTRQTGTPYLIRTLKPFIVDILANSQSYEVDPVKLKEGENVEDNMARLLSATQKILDAIVRSAPEFPLPLRVLSSHLMREVGKKFPASRLTAAGGIVLNSPSSERSNRKFTINKLPSIDHEIHRKEVNARRFIAAPAVGGFIFLRFIGPALLAPGAHGIIETTQHDGCCRAFVLISKVLQNLSNGIEFSKEVYMLKANQFISNNLDKVRAFFEAVASLPPTNTYTNPTSSTSLSSDARTTSP